MTRDLNAVSQSARTDSDDGAPTGTGLGRALDFTRRYSRMRHQENQATQLSMASYEDGLIALAEMAVPAFSDWCVVDLVDRSGERRVLCARHRGCARTESRLHVDCCATDGATRWPQRDTLIERALSSGESQWSREDHGGIARIVVVALYVNDLPFGTITFASDLDGPGFGPPEVAAAEEVTWRAAHAIERILLVRDTRDAVRRTQRIASQLHQLIAASITLTSLRNERDILRNIAGSAQSVFDVAVAVVSLDAGAAAPLRGVAHRGRPAVCTSPVESPVDELPRARGDGSEPWLENGWLVAPMVERRVRHLGVIAIRREIERGYSAEDREVLTLLAQMASTALGAAELSRSIQTSETRLRTLIDTAPVGIVEVDVEGRVRWWNRAASRVLAWTEFDDDTGAGDVNFPASVSAGLGELWSDVAQGGSVTPRDFVDVAIAGRLRILTASAALLLGADGEVQGILTLVDDVTNHRQLTAELRHANTMEIRGQVASRIAHDFNNLLTLIAGYAEILSHDLSGDERSSQMVRDIQATASRASLLTGQLQTIGRTNATEPVVFDPVAVIQSNAEVLERILGADIDLQWALDDPVGHVRADADQFEQMILNLSINARDAMPDGGVLRIAADHVVFERERAQSRGLFAGDFVRLTVVDTGVGMDEATRERCFEPLFTTKGPFKGTGMGLSSARRLVEESGGAIRCRSEVGRGTTFEILLPVVDEPVSVVVRPVSVSPPRGSATVLLAEDDEVLRRLMSQVLQRNGYEVIECDSGERALELSDEFAGRFDMLLSDVVMGAMNGHDLAATLQSRIPSLRVLLVSGTQNASIVANLTPGRSAFLAKPFKPSQLIDSVHELLSRRD